MTFEPRNPNKSKAELELDAAMAEYEERFGVEYVIDFAGDFMTMEETAAHVRRLIATGEKQILPRYDGDKVY